MNYSANALSICKHYEGFKAKPYRCPAGVITIGYGTTVYPNGIRVKLTDPGVSEKVATELLILALNDMAGYVNRLLKVKVNQNQFDALVCFAHNVGPDMNNNGIAEGLGDSTLLRLINESIVTKRTDWKKELTVRFNGWVWGGKPKKRIPGLVARRNTEAFLFCDGIVKYFN